MFKILSSVQSAINTLLKITAENSTTLEMFW